MPPSTGPTPQPAKPRLGLTNTLVPVAAELKTTFASHYTQVISLAQMLQPEVIAVYNQRATGTKLLVNPSLGLGG